jgi:hypothetical protein
MSVEFLIWEQSRSSRVIARERASPACSKSSIILSRLWGSHWIYPTRSLRWITIFNSGCSVVRGAGRRLGKQYEKSGSKWERQQENAIIKAALKGIPSRRCIIVLYLSWNAVRLQIRTKSRLHERFEKTGGSCSRNTVGLQYGEMIDETRLDETYGSSWHVRIIISFSRVQIVVHCALGDDK